MNNQRVCEYFEENLCGSSAVVISSNNPGKAYGVIVVINIIARKKSYRDVQRLSDDSFNTEFVCSFCCRTRFNISALRMIFNSKAETIVGI